MPAIIQYNINFITPLYNTISMLSCHYTIQYQWYHAIIQYNINVTMPLYNTISMLSCYYTIQYQSYVISFNACRAVFRSRRRAGSCQSRLPGSILDDHVMPYDGSCHDVTMDDGSCHAVRYAAPYRIAVLACDESALLYH